ncbi:MAG: hypothetical protein JSR46_01315 [Verrucomicrobia bacterium]|nr:hypothetical protein [Verrucomicrobiota bacterium]
MKKTLFLFIFILSGCTMPINSESYHTSRDVELVNITLSTTAEKIKKAYGLDPMGSGAAMPGGPIRELTLAFGTREPYTKEKLRDLLIKCANELVDQVNENKEMQQYLIKAPFTIENVQIIIYNHDKTGREVFEPEISTAEISEGILTYRTTDPTEPLRFKNRIKETYAEALQALSSNSNKEKA